MIFNVHIGLMKQSKCEPLVDSGGVTVKKLRRNSIQKGGMRYRRDKEVMREIEEGREFSYT